MLNIIKSLASGSKAPHQTTPFPKMRNVVLDIMDEGRRKNTIHLPFDADATAMLIELERINAGRASRITLTSYIAKALADTVAEDPRMQAYRKGTELVIFRDVDVSVMIERKVEGTRMPVPYIVRAVNDQGLTALDATLLAARTMPLYTDNGPLSKLEATFFALPRVIRKIVWFFIRRDPHLFRQVAGTVGLTSLPSQLPLRAIGMPITPMTLTLLVGAISPRLQLRDGQIIEKKIIQMNLSADHDIIDGAQMMRFIERLKKRLHDGTMSV